MQAHQDGCLMAVDVMLVFYPYGCLTLGQERISGVHDLPQLDSEPNSVRF